MIQVSSYIKSVLERGGTVVVPSRQRAHALRLAYAAERLAGGRKVWASPDTLPLEGWLTREVERHAATAGSGLPRLLSPAEEWLLWRQCTADATHGLDLVNRASLAESLRRSSGLAADLSIDLRALREPAGTEAQLLAAVHRAVEERCRKLGAAPLTAAVSGLPVIGDGRPVIFAGFLAPSPRIQSIVAARARQGFESARRSGTETVSLTSPSLVRAADEREELERIAQWCRSHLNERPDARLLVLLTGSGGRRERLATLIRQAIDPGGLDSPALVGIEGGRPLASLSLPAHALRTLALLGGEALEMESVLEWLRAPWWAEPGAAARADLDLWLRDQARLRLDIPAILALLHRAPRPLATAAAAISVRLDQAIACVGVGPGTPREWSERFRAALEALGWPGARTRIGAEQQTLVRFHELLDELGQLSAAARSLTLGTAVQWLAELASRTPYRPADEDPAVTVSAAYVDPVVRYDGLWVAGLHAEAFPPPVAPDPFLPLAAQIAAGWPAATAAGRLQEARTVVAAWRATAAELMLSAPARSEDIELLPSPLIEEWRTTTPTSDEARVSIWLPERLHRPGRLTEWRDVVGVEWSSQLPLPSGTRSIELQNQCPFRAYAELRLGSVQLGMPEPGVAPDARGQLLHGALQQLWERLGDSSALAALCATELDELLGSCIERAAAALAPAGEDPPARAAMARECRRTERLIRKLLDIERRRAPFTVRHTEYSSRLQLAGRELRLRIDRLDALEGGGVAILDYKSGRRVSPDWYGDRPSHPQLLAYLAAVGDEVLAMATVNVTAREVRFDGIAAREDMLPKVAGVKGPEGESGDPWQARIREWRGLVERLTVAFASGHAAVDPKPHACDFCHVAGICRVGDGLVGTNDDGAEDAAGSVDDE